MKISCLFSINYFSLIANSWMGNVIVINLFVFVCFCFPITYDVSQFLSEKVDEKLYMFYQDVLSL